ncbi:hypothetical protein ACDQ55_20385 [Chitinophaga sp. 30R24]|uniref:hypothetical protein n=1 Tax=Chitinophaga sp. 30R24 TaxID=3248838 RepID=UPI003B8FCABB
MKGIMIVLIRKTNAMATFNIQLNQQEIAVSQASENIFIVRLPEKTIHLERRQDNEGASHWFEEGKDNETTQTSQIGLAIETKLDS